MRDTVIIVAKVIIVVVVCLCVGLIGFVYVANNNAELKDALIVAYKHVTEQELRRQKLLANRPEETKALDVITEYGSSYVNIRGSTGFEYSGYVLVVSVAEKHSKWAYGKLASNPAISFIGEMTSGLNRETNYKVVISPRAGTKDIEAIFALEQEAQKMFAGR